MRLEVMQGGSGKWEAREIKTTWPHGRHEFTGRFWNGHVPKGVGQDVISRQLARSISERPGGDTQSTLGGGHVLGVYNTENGKIVWGQ
jgi:hypothetical protein